MTFTRITAALLLGTLAISTSAAADRETLTGKWLYYVPASALSPATESVTEFLADGSFTTRWTREAASATNPGFIMITGHYWRTGPDSYVTIAEAAMACATSASCRPYPEEARIGAQQSARFKILSDGEMRVNGELWHRL